MQKEITLSQITITFAKTFHTFGKMDPFLLFSIAKSQAKTQTITNAGKQATWKSHVVLNYFQEPTIIIKFYEQDLSTKQQMGEGKIEVKGLKNTGVVEFKIIQQNSDVVGHAICKYSVKTLPPSPLLTIKNVRCTFYKQTKFLRQRKPYFRVGCLGKSASTQAKEDISQSILSWDEPLRIKIKQGQKLLLVVQDKVEKGKKLFGYETYTKQFRTLSGSKLYYVSDQNHDGLCTIELDYETQYFVNKQQSVTNEQIRRKEEGDLFVINLEEIKGKLGNQAENFFFKFTLGLMSFKTSVIGKGSQFQIPLTQTLFSDKKQNKLTISAFYKDSKECLGFQEFSVQSITPGERQINFQNSTFFQQLSGTFSIKRKQKRQVYLSELKFQFFDPVAKLSPYILAKLGKWLGRTQTLDGLSFKFSKSITLKTIEDKQLLFQVYDEDGISDERICTGKIDIDGFKQSGQLKLALKKENGMPAGQLTCKYSIRVGSKRDELKKSSRKSESPRRENQKQKKTITEKKEQDQQNYQNNISIKNITMKQEIIKNEAKQYQSLSNSRQKQRFKLPSIMENRNYGDRIFDKQSSATLQKSIHVYSIPKADRFFIGPKYTGQPSYYVDTCFKPNSGRGVGFGFGTKKQFPDWVQKNMKQNPAPGAYIGSHDKLNQLKPKGPTFGISYKHYEKVTIPKQKNYRSTQRLKPLSQHIKK